MWRASQAGQHVTWSNQSHERSSYEYAYEGARAPCTPLVHAILYSWSHFTRCASGLI